MKRPWFRMHARVKDDAKLQLLPAGLFKTWVNLCCIACEREGRLPDVQAIAYSLHKSAENTLDVISKLSKPPFQLVDRDNLGNLQMHDWDDWQYLSDVSTERVRKHRGAHETYVKQVRNVSETVSDCSVETDQRQKQIQIQNNPPNPPPKTTAVNGWKDTAFEEFWGQCVWAKIGRGAALAEYRKKATTPELAKRINAAAKEQTPRLRAEAARREGGVPLHPRTWLHQDRWADEQTPPFSLFPKEYM